MDNNRLLELFASYHKGTATAAETEELMAQLQQLPNEKLEELLRHTWDTQEISQPFFSAGTRERFLESLQQAGEEQAPVRAIRSQRSILLRIAAAAVVVLIVSVTAVMLFRNKNNDVVKTPEKQTPPGANTITPGRDQAVLTLADGTQIVLDTAANGNLARQGGVKVIKLDGRLTYDSKQHTAAQQYNTISTPRGGQYQLELADGSKVWLNAASTLRFPTAFTGNERIVELTGEGYFEVAKNASKPFHVQANGVDVEVLGTHFNINSYTDEPAIKTTLLEGRVRVVNNNESKKTQEVILKPGEQAIANCRLIPLQSGTNCRLAIDHSPNIEEVMAWKNGRFFYNSADLETVMRQIARWYDVEVVYEKKTNETISGGLPRSGNISQLLQILEETGNVNFEIKGKQIIVKPR